MRSSAALAVNRNGPTENLVDWLEMRADASPDRTAYAFLRDDGSIAEIGYAQLAGRARAIAAHLQAEGMERQRAVLLYQPGSEYITAFFACLYAGVAAVPAFTPRPNAPRGDAGYARIRGIAADAQAALMLTTQAALAGLGPEGAREVGGGAAWLATDAIPAESAASWRRPSLEPDDLAFLQYTSGSTAAPRGVMLNHGSLIHNLEQIRRNVGIHTESHAVIWLPPYHDMGLIAGILEPIYSGIPVTLMTPAAAIQRPFAWLSAISGRRSVISGGPNFAYQLCVQKIKPEQRDALDLSGWEVAFSGAEPICAETLDRFAEYFAPCGFRKEAFFPCYGLAEATLYVTGAPGKRPSHAKSFSKEALEQGRAVPVDAGSEQARTLISCGVVDPSQKLAIVDPETHELLQPGRVGEIWVAGPSIASGYWNRSEESDATFRARLPAHSRDTFLRTGDLGFVDEGEVYVTGRIKDLIIIRGRNHYPQDIEFTAAECHADLRKGGGAVFSVEREGEEQLVVVQELNPRRSGADFREMTLAIRKAVSAGHQLQVFAIALLKAGAIPKTSSGKIQRRATKARFLADDLNPLFLDQR
ncbi:fatty acyl-AMP ligase [Methylocaldum sp. MU1018]